MKIDIENNVKIDNYLSPCKTTPFYSSIQITIIGIYFCYITSTVIQESLYGYRNPDSYNRGGERFESAALLLFVKSVSNFIFSNIMIYLNGIEKVGMSGNMAISTAILKFIGAYLSIYSLNYISYPLLVLGRSVKIIPVFLSEIAVGVNIPSMRRCISVIITTVGMILFSSGKIFNGNDSNKSIIGIGLLIISLAIDGLMSGVHSSILKDNSSKNCSLSTMAFISKWQTVLSFIVMVMTSDSRRGVLFCIYNRKVLVLIVVSSLIESLGQVCIYSMIVNHGTFKTVLVTTIRKFVTILISIFVFGHHIDKIEWFSIIVVFLGLSIYMKKK